MVSLITGSICTISPNLPKIYKQLAAKIEFSRLQTIKLEFSTAVKSFEQFPPTAVYNTVIQLLSTLFSKSKIFPYQAEL